MKTIIVYNSHTGFTKRYAEWLSEETDAAIVPLKDAKSMDLSSYDTIVYGGWAMGGSINKLEWFKENMGNWEGKKLVVFCVGANPAENPKALEAVLANFTEEEKEKVSVFYCPGGFNYDKMAFGYKIMMKMFRTMIKNKKDKTEEDIEMAKMIATSYDISDKKYITPIVECIKG